MLTLPDLAAGFQYWRQDKNFTTQVTNQFIKSGTASGGANLSAFVGSFKTYASSSSTARVSYSSVFPMVEALDAPMAAVATNEHTVSSQRL